MKPSRAYLQRILKPEIEEVALYVLAVIAIAGYAFYQFAIEDKSGEVASSFIGSFISLKGIVLSFAAASDAIGSASLFVLWAFIGLAGYAFVWWAISTAANVKKDIAFSDRYVHPDSFHASDYWAHKAMRIGQRFALFFVTFVIALVWLFSFAPGFANSFITFYSEPTDTYAIAGLLGSLLLIPVTLHLVVVSLKAAIYKNR